MIRATPGPSSNNAVFCRDSFTTVWRLLSGRSLLADPPKSIDQASPVSTDDSDTLCRPSARLPRFPPGPPRWTPAETSAEQLTCQRTSQRAPIKTHAALSLERLPLTRPLTKAKGCYREKKQICQLPSTWSTSSTTRCLPALLKRMGFDRTAAQHFFEHASALMSVLRRYLLPTSTADFHYERSSELL